MEAVPTESKGETECAAATTAAAAVAVRAGLVAKDARTVTKRKIKLKLGTSRRR